MGGKRRVLRLVIAVAIGFVTTFIAVLVYFILYDPFGPGF